METQSLFMIRRQYCQDVNITQSNLQIKCNYHHHREYAFCRKKKIQPIIHMKSKKLGKAKTILKWKRKLKGLMLPGFRTNFKATIIKTEWYWHRDRPIK